MKKAGDTLIFSNPETLKRRPCITSYEYGFNFFWHFSNSNPEVSAIVVY
ncbi:hypothetical protein AB0758_00630 [Tolypothrix bouteillei VB521301_2]